MKTYLNTKSSRVNGVAFYPSNPWIAAALQDGNIDV
jgi:hypothetical protein